MNREAWIHGPQTNVLPGDAPVEVPDYATQIRIDATGPIPAQTNVLPNHGVTFTAGTSSSIAWTPVGSSVGIQEHHTTNHRAENHMTGVEQFFMVIGVVACIAAVCAAALGVWELVLMVRGHERRLDRLQPRMDDLATRIIKLERKP